MFADPQSITINAVANSLPRIAVGNQKAVYSNDTDTLSLTISHVTTSRGRTRRMARVDQSKISADPFTPSQNREVSGSVYLVVDEPADGAFSNADLLALVKGLTGWLNDANVSKVLAGES